MKPNPNTQQGQIDAVRVEAFFQTLAQRGSVAAACKAARTTRQTVNKLFESDADFRERWADAIKDFGDSLKDAAYHRAVEGVFEPKYHEGQECFSYERDEAGRVIYDEGVPRIRKYEDGTPVLLGVRRYSDSLLLKMLASNCPEYKDTSRLELGNVPGESFATNDPTLAGARKIAFALTMAARRIAEKSSCETPSDPPDDNSDLG